MPALEKEFVKPSWGDDIDDFEQDVTETQDEEGVFTTVEETKNDEGKNIKITRKLKKKLIKEAVYPVVAERKKLRKFGKSKNDGPGPQTETTNLSEEVKLVLSSSKKNIEKEEVEEKPKLSNIVCRHCQGNHWSMKCPFKDSLGSMGSLSEIKSKGTDSRESLASIVSNDEPKTNKYVPPGLRNRTASGQDVRGMGEKPQYDDRNTIRITNLSEDTTDHDLNDLIRRFGPTQRVFFKRDKGYAFVTFVIRADAENALNTLNGYGYDNLILHVEWSNR